jgi:glycerol-3-phosphate acyltransferase PlsX
MGGDVGPAVMLAGAARAHGQRDDLSFLMFGDKALVRAELDKHSGLRDAVEIVHCDDVIAGTGKAEPGHSPRKTTSMGRAVAAVKMGQAQAAISAGNTGALMAMSKLALRTMPGIDRPALAALLPTLGENDLVMLDLGANTEANTQNLVQFAVMGAAYSRVALDLERPRVQLLNIGTEALKGTDTLKEAAAILRDADYLGLRFDGFIEGDKISRGDVDVVVSDGFSGNIALKTAEGTARFRDRSAAPRLHQFGALQDRLPDFAPRDRIASASSRSEQPQWRGLSRPERCGGEEPWQRQRKGRCQCNPRRRPSGARGSGSQDQGRSRQHSGAPHAGGAQ